LKADPFSSFTICLSRLISFTEIRRTRSGGRLFGGMLFKIGMAEVLVGFIAGGPCSLSLSLNGLPLNLTGSFPPVMKVVRLTTVIALLTLTFLKFITTFRLMVMFVIFTLCGP
jgi:hypothetical protein